MKDMSFVGWFGFRSLAAEEKQLVPTEQLVLENS